SVCSTGALKRDIPVPSLAVPEDYIDLTQGQTFIEDEIRHVTPVLNKRIRLTLVDSAKRSGIPVRDGGVYVQTRGPRLETRAEVRVLSEWGDYVGMNLGSEATLANESDLPVAGLVTINNYANGLTEEEPDYRKILGDARSMWDTVWSILEAFPGELFDR
ncbi:MAG: 5'-methylthioadenosine phosphorylase, partial [Candidatus Thermoplasmatota archaeon]|nr:5'-methylthioadenosine phosphorylase [Candidatus Thermoplasmatota archaeon]